DQLVGYGEHMPLDVLSVRDDDIPDLVQEDVCDLGLLGLNVLEEKRLELAARGGAARFMPVRRLDFGRCRLALAIPTEAPWQGVDSLRGKRIATTYPFLLERFLREREVTSHIVTLAGAVEIAPRLKRADLICDLVASGATLEANHLREVETVLECHAVLVRTPLTLPPEKEDWVQRLLMRIDGVQQVREVLDAVRRDGDAALRALTRRFDGVELESLAVSEAEFAAARGALTAQEISALARAVGNVRAFHLAQRPTAVAVETEPGVRCEQLIRPTDAVGLYVPAGRAPLPSTVIMLAVPSEIAGCPRRVLCTPPSTAGTAHPAVLVAAELSGIDTVFKVGGAQAIAALAVRVQAAITTFLPQLERRAVLAQSLISCRCILVPDPETAVAVANAYAPEHLLLQVREPRRWLAGIRNAGAVFLGAWSPEP